MDIFFAIVGIIVTSAGVRARFPLSAEGRVRDFLLNQANFSVRDRPVLDSDHAVDVQLLISFFAMYDLNERNEVITTAAYLNLEWLDERLCWDPEDFSGVDLVIVYPDEIWIPNIMIANSLNEGDAEVVSPNRGSILLSSDGAVNLGTPLVQSTHCPLSIRYFPFDSQVCPFQFIPQNQLSEQVNLTVRPNPAQPGLDTNQWTVVDTHVSNLLIPLVNYTHSRPVSYVSTSTICVHLERDPKYYVLTLIVPSTLMCFLAFVTFLAPTDSGERISLGVSMVLGLTVFQLLVSDTLPTASKETPILSQFLTVNFVLACLAVPMSLGNINIAYGDSKLPLMTYAWFRKVVLQVLPWILRLPTFEDRLRKESKVMLVPRSPGKGEEGVSVGEASAAETTKKGRRVDAMLITNSSPVREDLTPSEKAKLEARTIALVMDRLTWACFFLGFCGYSTSLIIKNQMKTGPPIEDCLAGAV